MATGSGHFHGPLHSFLPQYILEIQPEDHEKPSRYEWLDEGRMEVAEHPAREIDPETVKGEKPGSGFFPDFLPEPALF